MVLKKRSIATQRIEGTIFLHRNHEASFSSRLSITLVQLFFQEDVILLANHLFTLPPPAPTSYIYETVTKSLKMQPRNFTYARFLAISRGISSSTYCAFWKQIFLCFSKHNDIFLCIYGLVYIIDYFFTSCSMLTENKRQDNCFHLSSIYLLVARGLSIILSIYLSLSIFIYLSIHLST